MNKKITLLYIILNSLIFTQFNNPKISYEYNDLIIKDNQIHILEKFNQVMIDYYKYNKFSDYSDLDIELDIHIIYHGINFTDLNNYKSINCQIFFSNNSGQYYITKNIELPYYKGRDIYYNSMHFDPIASLFDYYAYLFIGDQLDTYGIYLGDNYYNLASEITKMGLESKYSSLWVKHNEWIKSIKENIYLRNAKYYFFKSLDIIFEKQDDTSDIIENTNLLLNNLELVYKNYGYDKNTLKFIESFNLEIADLFKMLNLYKGINFLINFDYKNKVIYEKYLENE